MSSNNNNYNNNENEDTSGKETAESIIGHKPISNILKTLPSICSSNLKEVVVVSGDDSSAGPSGVVQSSNLLLPNTSTVLTTHRSSSSEDLSEYTDADESISAPTEFLAEFLSAVMMRDFNTALKYCKLILQYEPNNAAAKEFYPLIIEKIKLMADKSDSSSEAEGSVCDDNSDATSASGEKHNSEDSDATTASYSSLEDEEADSRACDNNDISLSQLKIPGASDGNGNGVTPHTNYLQHKSMQQQVVTSFPLSSSDSESPTEPISQAILNV